MQKEYYVNKYFKEKINKENIYGISCSKIINTLIQDGYNISRDLRISTLKAKKLGDILAPNRGNKKIITIILEFYKVKYCNKCKIVKKYEEFHSNRGGSNNLSNSCKECRLLEQKSYYNRNKEEHISKVRSRERNLERYLTTKELNDIFRRDEFKCVRCNLTNIDHNILYATNLHIDHIIPVSKGGLTTVENSQLLCRTCNITKGNK